MQQLKDTKNDRVYNKIPLPPQTKLLSKYFWKDNSQKKVNHLLIRDFLRNEGKIRKQDFQVLIIKVTKILKNESNILQLEEPINIIGDIHGQYFDLLRINEIGGSPSKWNYLFLGDYVDRGDFSIEVLIFLLSWKLNFPNKVFLLRGNHECQFMTQSFDFYQECLKKFDQETYNLLINLFNTLPICAIINNDIFALHGGISPELTSIQDLKVLNRFKEIPKEGLFCDLFWSDPISDKQTFNKKLFIENSSRRCSFQYGKNALMNFFQQNNFKTLIRAHEVQIDGFKIFDEFEGQNENLVTIFSAPNYCKFYNNKAAIIQIDMNLLSIRQFSSIEQPYILPKFMNVFQWSLPYVAEKSILKSKLNFIKIDGSKYESSR